MAITFGNVPHPSYLDRPIVKAEGHGQNNLGQRSVKGVVYHRMIGTLWGTDAYFRFPSTDALTDYGVGTSYQDGDANDGTIIRWNDPLGIQSGWASGPVNGAYGDGLAFVNKYGINAVNRDQASIEISGKTYETLVSESTFYSVAELSAYWADQYEIPWDTYPISPKDGFSFVRWHQEFCKGTGKICPGPVVMNATNHIIDLTIAILKKYQTGNYEPVPPPEEPPVAITYPDGMDDGVATYLFGPQFDPKGPVSQMWVERGKVTGEWPRLAEIKTFDTRTYYRFEGGWCPWKTGNAKPKELKA